MYQATSILYPVKRVHTGMIHTLNEIVVCPPAEVGFHNGNEWILNEYGIDYLIQIQHDSYYHGQDDNNKDIPPVNWPKRLFISWENCKYIYISLLPK